VDPATGTVLGDPTEVALLQAAQAAGVAADALAVELPRVDEVPFDSVRKRMTTVHDDGTTTLVICKGAPDHLLVPEVLAEPAELLATARLHAEEMAAGGQRVLAVAQRSSPRAAPVPAAAPGGGGHPPQPPALESGLRLLGLVALRDPLRDSAVDTVAECRGAGIDVALVTGDHPATAASIAGQVGIDGAGGPVTLSADASADQLSEATRHRVVARATPANKLDLVRRWQDAGHVVAMTGDGVNDGPALNRADIGVAMGGRGTEVARQAADVVLVDDDLGTLVAAVEEGRRVYANIRRFLLYGLSGGAAEILLMLLGPAFGVPLPLLPAQILWVNLLTHSFAGAALGAEPVEAGTMQQPPRPPGQGVLAGGLWWRVGVLAAFLAVASLCAGIAAGPATGRSAALLSLGAGQLAVAWGIRALRSAHGSGTPRALAWALPCAGLLLVASVVVPPLRTLLGTQPLSGSGWAFAALTALGAVALTRALRPRVL
jgi:Ca2+-transporting ATPase